MDRDKAKYRIIKDHIISSINDGSYAVSGKIPSENELARSFDASRQTVMHAMSQLVSEGALRRVQGMGTFVCEKHPARFNSEKMIGVILTYPDEYTSCDIITGIGREVAKEGYDTVIRYTDNMPDRERDCLGYFLGSGISGLITETSRNAHLNPNMDLYRKIAHDRLPVIYMNGCPEGSGCSCVSADEVKAGYIAAKHLVEKGHRSVSGIFMSDDIRGVKRHEGSVKALKEAGTDCGKDKVLFYTADERENLFNGGLIGKVMAAIKDSTALMVQNEHLAVKIMGMLREIWVRVPEDISVISFDDSLETDIIGMSVTTVACRKNETGTAAGKGILSVIHGNGLYNIVLEPRLIDKGSVRDTMQKTEDDIWESIV
jgi:GntR family transcriptional regulator, arabinose operon transcriptional repressor